MNYYHLNSLVAAGKKRFDMPNATDSFYVPTIKLERYIEPTFSKIIFEAERPPILLISAVGATGKSTLAQVLSHETGLPLLDLGKHKPVGDNTLTGLLTSSFNVQHLSEIFQGFASGSFGIIIDGVDEGRSKTNEKAFDAFLDDIARLCSSATNTTVIMLGRSQILDDCWAYFDDKKVPTGLLTISPFSVDQAKKYIDIYGNITGQQFSMQYEEARDMVLEKLSSAFLADSKEDELAFNSFIGYPPVLDAIVTLLKEEKNYHKLIEEIDDLETSDVEIQLLYRIADYILRREDEQKVKPNIVMPLVANLQPGALKDEANLVFDSNEQCIRLLAHCVGRPLNLRRISEPVINDKYEEHLTQFLPEHPFLNRGKFRNPIFESMAIAVVMNSSFSEAADLVLAYCASNKHSYHLIYLLKAMSGNNLESVKYLPVILASAMEFRSVNTVVEMNVSGPETEDEFGTKSDSNALEVEIDLVVGKTREVAKSFKFTSNLDRVQDINVCGRFASTYISVPCDLYIIGGSEIEITAPAEITAKNIHLQASSLVLRRGTSGEAESSVILDAQKVFSTIETIVPNGVQLSVLVCDTTGLIYPIVQYSEKKEPLPEDSHLREKYFRLKRILLEFRSHSKGSLAKYKDKIEHERVLKNALGRSILDKLLVDGILVPEGNLYHIKPDALDKHLGVSWLDLRRSKTSATLLAYLRAI